MRLVFSLLLTLGVVLAFGQNYPKDYFRSPLDIPILLAGNFAEMRSNHFHGGIDIKTEGVEGKKVYAAADGFVSRIKISTYGYGKTIYIDHPNGYTTVYAHLREFNEEIDAFVKQAQYHKESFEIELFPGSRRLPVKKGDVIALSGNTGGSSGPHLHFEIRDTKSEYPINPLLFGFDVKDDIQPLIRSLSVYPIDLNSRINGKHQSVNLDVVGSQGNYRLKADRNLALSGNIGFGIEVQDHLNGTSNRCGVFSIQLEVDGKSIYAHKMEKVGFHETRYINSHVDYEERQSSRRWVQKCYIAPNNRLGIYDRELGDGIIKFEDDLNHEVRYIIHDTHGNRSELSFTVDAKKPQKITLTALAENTETSSGIADTFLFNRPNIFKKENIELHLPVNSLYDDIPFEYKTLPRLKNSFSPVFQLHKSSVPVHSYFVLSIKPDSIPDHLRDKAVIANVGAGGYTSAKGGEFKGDFITTRIRDFGRYTVMVDTVAPVINSLNLYDGRNMAGFKSIKFKITDDLSGIKDYRATIDKKWVLMEYDYKTGMLFYEFDERVQSGKHELELVITDERGNKSEYKATFTN